MFGISPGTMTSRKSHHVPVLQSVPHGVECNRLGGFLSLLKDNACLSIPVNPIVGIFSPLTVSPILIVLLLRGDLVFISLHSFHSGLLHGSL